MSMQGGPKAPIVAAPTAFLGAGCIVQGLGIALAPVGFFFGVWASSAFLAPGIERFAAGAVVGLVTLLGFLLAGRAFGAKVLCGACRNPVASCEVRVCPACRAELTSP